MDRTVWRQQWDKCWRCGCRQWPSAPPHSVHEIRGGPMRAKAVKEPALWVWLCANCHSKVQSQPSMYATMLALKARFDPAHYNREQVNMMIAPTRRGGWTDGPVTELEVIEAAFEINT